MFMHQLLVDNGSFVNILAYGTYQKLKLSDKDMMACYDDLYGFTSDSVQIVRRVKLSITYREEPIATTQVVEFMIVNDDISYNGRLMGLMCTW